MLQRDIVITEDPTMHLVWFENTIFMKPIPVALLSWEFWRRFICVSVKQEGGTEKQERGAFYAAACWFLLSYTVLITHPSDYRLAVSHHLIPDLGWKNWCLLSHDIRTSFFDSNFPTERRWEYGELRLSRLNWIYKLTLRGYSYSYMFTEYRTYFSKNFQLLLLAFAYCSVVLAAMQVVMTSSEPGVWLADLCFKFSVLIILFVFAVVCAIVGLFVSLFVYHLLLTLAFKRKFRLRPQMAWTKDIVWVVQYNKASEWIIRVQPINCLGFSWKWILPPPRRVHAWVEIEILHIPKKISHAVLHFCALARTPWPKAMM
jgi:hypothetical protein